MHPELLSSQVGLPLAILLMGAGGGFLFGAARAGYNSILAENDVPNASLLTFEEIVKHDTKLFFILAEVITLIYQAAT